MAGSNKRICSPSPDSRFRCKFRKTDHTARMAGELSPSTPPHSHGCEEKQCVQHSNPVNAEHIGLLKRSEGFSPQKHINKQDGTTTFSPNNQSLISYNGENNLKMVMASTNLSSNSIFIESKCVYYI